MSASSMDRIREAILAKVEAEAQQVIGDAERKSQQEIEKARKLHDIRVEEKKRETLQEAEQEGARVVAQASIKAHQNLSAAKADAVAKIVDGVKKSLAEIPADKGFSPSLIAEALDGLGGGKGRVYVPHRDVKKARALIKGDKKLADRIVEVRELDSMGGVVTEDVEGKVRIDNTFETRLEMLLPKLLPEISEELFKGRRGES